MAGKATIELSELECRSLLDLTHVKHPFTERKHRAIMRAQRKLRVGLFDAIHADCDRRPCTDCEA